ncbi:unnamed protein product [Litomosoides sigmodontis]|uniref:NADH:flavin oxidoreductase/NADH oxidase N-terminal domain-containing protein n=1 Tax=Litomosoides sigmodontis TaxID=42156 RepID=A0A3P7K216_LITSI|nr:unnamed protein product [Litomosoides sigmodontis]
MATNGIINNYNEPLTRWDCPDVDQETVKTILGERLRFPYASNIVAPNRLMKSAMSEQLATYDRNNMKKSGIPTGQLINLYEKFADGGFGTIVTGCIMINGKDIEAPGNVIIDKELDSEERRNKFEEWTQCAKKNGSIVIAQLFHPGKHAADLPHKTDFDINKLTQKQIIELINDYAYAASYAQQCGFNGVEISCTYFFALGQLITSSNNIRDDEFGGELDNRTKILFKIIQAIRRKISKPSRFVIGLKLFYGNFEPDYNDDAFGEFVHNVEKTGFDYIAITGGNYNLIKDLKQEDDPQKCENFYQNFVLTMRKYLTRTKVFMNGGFVKLTDMVNAVNNGWAAGISIARPVAAEPDLPKRLFAGEVKSATKSLFDSIDQPVEIEFAGSQLWQHSCSLTVMDASNPDHVEQFKKDLHFHEKQKLCGSDAEELVIGYPKTIINPELLDEDAYMLKGMQQATEEIISNGAVTLAEGKLAKTTDDDDDETEREMIEEETHHVVKKQLDYGALGDFQENTVEDSIHTVVKRHENLADIGVDIIEETETIEKVILTQSDFSESHQVESTESPKHEPQQVDIKHDGDVLKVAAETLNMKAVVESVAVEEDVQVVDEVVKDITEGLHKENELVSACIVVDKPEQHLETLSSAKQSEIKETAEVIAGLSDDEKPIISGVVEEVKNVTDNTMKAVEHTAEQENAENRITENERHATSSRESVAGVENYDVDENVVGEIMRKEIYAVSEQMTKSFIEDSAAEQTELLPGKGDEHFADTSEFQDTEINHEITKSTDDKYEQEDHLQDHSLQDEVVAHVPKDMMEVYIPKDITEDYIPEIAEEEHFLEGTDGISRAISLTSSHFHDDNMDHGVGNDFLSDKTMSKDVTTDDDHIQEYPAAKDCTSQYQHQEGFLQSGIGQPGWDELSGEADHYKAYSTLFGSTLVSGNGGHAVYDEYRDDHSLTEQSPTYRNEIYEIPSAESKDARNAEKLSSEEVDTSQVQQKLSVEFDDDKLLTDNSTTTTTIPPPPPTATATTHRHGLTDFISSTLSDSVQSLITSTKNKFDEMLGENDGKQQLDLQFTQKTEKLMDDDGLKYEIHTESCAVSGADPASPLSGFNGSKAFLAVDSDKFKTHDDNNLTGGSTDDTHHSTKTTITTTTLTGRDDKESNEHRDGLLGDKKSYKGQKGKIDNVLFCIRNSDIFDEAV